MTDRAPVPSMRRTAFGFILVTVVLDVLSFGMIIPVLPKLVESFVGGNTQQAAEIYGLFGTVWALMQFAFSPFLGVLSDRFGRRPVVLLSCFGLGFDYFLMAMAPSLSWLFVGRVISGITAASFTVAGAYIADVTPPEKRAASFGMIGAAWGVGFVLGPAIGGWLGFMNPRLPFWAAGVLSLVNALYGVFVLPESLPAERRARFEWGRANPVGALSLLRSHPELFGLACVNFLYQFAHHVLPSVFVLYASHRYGWNERRIGSTLAVVGICGIVVQGALIKPIISRLGERGALMAGLFFGMAGFLVYGMASTGKAFWAGVPVFALMGLFGPALQGLMTRHVSPSEQGQLQGANNSLMGITGLFGPGLFTFTFATFIGSPGKRHLPGAPFLLAALMLGAAMVLALFVTRSKREVPAHPIS